MAAKSKGIDTAPLHAWSSHALDRLGTGTGGNAPLRTYLEKLRAVCNPVNRRSVALSLSTDDRHVLFLDDEKHVLVLEGEQAFNITPEKVRSVVRRVVRDAVLQRTGYLGD